MLRLKFILFSVLILGLSYSSCQDMINSLPSFDVIDVELMGKLPGKLKENSGLVIDGKDLIFLNDGGNGPFLFRVDSSDRTITRKMLVDDAKNHDWEELTTDSSFLYIADIGNNSQKRKNLRIYAIDRSRLNQDTLSVSHKIKFKYEDQKSFPPKKKRNFDCEAILSIGDSLFLFTKNYGDNKCNVYSIDKNSSEQKARKTGSFVSEARVTGAAMHPSGDYFVLIAYKRKSGSSFIWIIKNDDNLSQIHLAPKRILRLPIKAQTEAIAHLEANKFIISSEKGSSLAARTFLVDLDGYLLF